MERMEINKVFVVGSGLMGTGIAQVCAQSGIQVILYDIKEEALGKSLETIEWSLAKFIEKGKLREDKETILGRIKTKTQLSAVAEVDLVVEAVFETAELKLEIFRAIDEACGKSVVLASNTSAIPITDLAAVTRNPGKVLGLHFFSPVPMMQAVEVIRGVNTSDETMETGLNFV
jgi:3-hydroxybutyryl-CoA dehydrogenase